MKPSIKRQITQDLLVIIDKKKLRSSIIKIFHEIRDSKAYNIIQEQKSGRKERRVNFLSMMSIEQEIASHES